MLTANIWAFFDHRVRSSGFYGPEISVNDCLNIYIYIYRQKGKKCQIREFRLDFSKTYQFFILKTHWENNSKYNNFFAPTNMMIFKLSVLFLSILIAFLRRRWIWINFFGGKIFFSVTTQWLNACTWGELASKTFSTACQSRSKLFWAAKKPAQQHWTLHSALKSRKSASPNICEAAFPIKMQLALRNSWMQPLIFLFALLFHF